jgi:uncharacterized membrane protein
MTAAVLSDYLRDWLNLGIRWLHVIAAIGWIGSSFYFVLLDQSLRKPKRPEDEEAGVKGELWEVHGGGFYHVQKYQVAPRELPDHLAWFKWEAYATWLSGFALLVVLYWLDARAYMIDPSVADLSPAAAVGLSAGLLVGAWLVYDVLCRIVRNERLLWVLLLGVVALTAWGTSELYTARAAWLQTGAMLGTIMAGSVLFNIIPAHWELIRAKEAGREPDPAPGIEAKRRSVHNNYFTLPVLITMLAGHFTFLTGRDNAWLILMALMLLGAWIRHFYNLRHGGKTHWWMLVAAAVALIALIVGLRPEEEPRADTKAPAAKSAKDSGADGKGVFTSAGCNACHTLSDANASGSGGPNLDESDASKEQIAAQVRSGGGGMPAYSGKLSDEEIEAVAEYVAESSDG